MFPLHEPKHSAVMPANMNLTHARYLEYHGNFDLSQGKLARLNGEVNSQVFVNRCTSLSSIIPMFISSVYVRKSPGTRHNNIVNDCR